MWPSPKNNAQFARNLLQKEKDKPNVIANPFFIIGVFQNGQKGMGINNKLKNIFQVGPMRDLPNLQ